jgi:hypothetical protein
MVRLYKQYAGDERVVVIEAWRTHTRERMGALEGTDNTRTQNFIPNGWDSD